MPSPSESAWTLAIGPGHRLGKIVPLMEALRGEAPSPSLWRLSDVAPLLDPRGAIQRVVLDAAEIPIEDVGLVRRSLIGGLEMVLVGGDPTGAVVRALQGEPGVRWLAWPLDTDSLNALVRYPRGPESVRHQAGDDDLGPDDDQPRDPGSPWASPSDLRSPTEADEDTQRAERDDDFDEEFYNDDDDLENFEDDEFDYEDEEDLEVQDDFEDDLADGSLRAELLRPSADVAVDDSGGSERVPGDLPPPPAFPDDPELAAIEEILGRPGSGRVPSEDVSQGDDDTAPLTTTDTLVPHRTEPDPFDTDEPGAFLAARDAIAASDGVTMSRDEIDAFTSEPLVDAAPLNAAHFDMEFSGGTATADPGADSAPPSWYRDQIADLADQAQKLDLGLRLAREMGGEDGLNQLEADVAGLLAFTRTLGFVAAPPARGTQELDLDTLIEEQLGGLASADEDMPRIFYRGEPGLRIRADKSLLVLALDAVLNLAARCAGPDGVVHTSMEPGALIRIDFPAGPLAGRDASGLLDPYAVHRSVPGIGPNALAAADRILAGQGGRLAIGELEDDTLRFEIKLPTVDIEGEHPSDPAVQSGAPAPGAENISGSGTTDTGVPGPFTAGP
jgi:hypothetical protein